MLTDDLMREVRRLQVRTRRRVEGLFAGEYHTAFKGRGIEFADVREYEPGDDVRSIDWNVTARTGKTFIKRFVEERELTVMLAVDLSGSGVLASAGKSKGRTAVELAAVLALAAAQNNDRVGLLIFTDRVEKFLPPRKGRIHILRLMRELLNFEPAGKGTDIAGAVEHLGRVLRKRALVFVISDFLDAGPPKPVPPVTPPPKPPRSPRTPLGGATGAENWEHPLRLASRKHEMIAVSIADPREAELPAAGLVELADAETGECTVIDTSSRRAREQYRRLAAIREQELARTLARSRVDRIAIRTDRPFIRDLERYFHLRERRR
ncbi:MAG: DUF58 domain-containing protein [Phycisphaerales bacterium]